MSKDITDFVEDLKAHQITVTVGGRRVDVVTVSVIDFILSEMEGDNYDREGISTKRTAVKF